MIKIHKKVNKLEDRGGEIRVHDLYPAVCRGYMCPYLAPQVLKSYLLCMVYAVSARNTAVVISRDLSTRSTS